MGSVCARVKAQYRVRERELGACTCIARATESARVVASASDEHEGAHTGQGRSQRIDLRLPCVSTCLKLQAEATPLGRHAARAATRQFCGLSLLLRCVLGGEARGVVWVERTASLGGGRAAGSRARLSGLLRGRATSAGRCGSRRALHQCCGHMSWAGRRVGAGVGPRTRACGVAGARIPCAGRAQPSAAADEFQKSIMYNDKKIA